MTAAATAMTPRSQPAPVGLPRLLASLRADGQPVTLSQHVDWYDTVGSAAHGHELVSIVEASGLRGRGGAGFPTATKLRAVGAANGRPIVVANGAEGEPASGKDRALLRAAPHLVLDGAVLAAAAVGAREAIVTVAAAAVTERRVLEASLFERKRARVDGRISLRLIVVPDGFVTGEETALVQFLNGRPAKPTFVPPRPFERGVGGAPTLVQNVETLAHIALIARYGAQWFRDIGTADEPGSMLVTVSGSVASAGVHEVPVGMRFVDLLGEAAGLTEPVAAFLVGGYFGTWLGSAETADLALSDASLARHSGGLGAGVVVALPRSTCAVSEVARVASFLANESAGQCGPCIHGLRAIADGMCRIAGGDADERARLTRWAEEVRGRGACKHPDGATRFVASALTAFHEEIETHLHHGRCGAEDRQILRVFHSRASRR